MPQSKRYVLNQSTQSIRDFLPRNTLGLMRQYWAVQLVQHVAILITSF